MKAKSKKPRIKKNGQPYKKPIKPTVEQYDARVDAIIDVISDQPNLSRYKIHKIFCARFNVRWETIDRYLARARETLRERLKRDKEEVRSNAVAFYEMVISNPKNPPNVRLRAQESLCELLGVNAPSKVELTGAEGGPVSTETHLFLSGMSVEELKAAIGKLEDSGDNKA